jgi:hypothetical protein
MKCCTEREQQLMEPDNQMMDEWAKFQVEKRSRARQKVLKAI